MLPAAEFNAIRRIGLDAMIDDATAEQARLIKFTRFVVLMDVVDDSVTGTFIIY